ncbi:hypothetical protein GUA46_06885 [Muricauda sp. HICW]|uniref:GLPGLI family protein n=1 Tax=Flagellimonas chongwuensis TaxID=2697365 RepID=A0A850NDW7_9FLAO|nr:hypothetical protein [Allomuricauda chongwuensis]NVN18059.1 hypothetical protein [Allomuricauda chongwuensis]
MKSLAILIITIILCTANTKAQNTKAVLIFKNGTQLEGLANLKPWDNIRFRKEKGAKREHFTFNEVDTLKLFKEEEPSIYVKVKIKDKDNPKVLELVNHGKNISCYRDVVNPRGNMMMTPMPNGGMMTTGFWGTITYSYLRKAGEEEATHLASSYWITLNFRKNASEFFADCPPLASKIQDRELQRGDLEEIIDYYNTQCK